MKWFRFHDRTANDARRPRRGALWCLLGTWCLLTIPASGQDLKLQARLQPQQAQVGDTVVYSVTVTYGQQTPPAPTLPSFDPAWGLSGLQTAGNLQQTSIVNGKVSASVEYRFSFQTSKEGVFNVGPASITVGGQTVQSNPVTLTVAKSMAPQNLPAELAGKILAPQVRGATPELAKALNGVVFILPVIETTTPYDGQQVLLTYHLCLDNAALGQLRLRPDHQFADSVAVPDLKQFLKEVVFDIPKDLKFETRQFGNRQYEITPLYQVAITPTKTGVLAVDPFRISLRFQSPQRGGRSSFFDDSLLLPGMDPFASRIQVLASSPPMQLDVRPLPTQGRPRDFSGAVGDFKLTATVDKNKVIANEDIVKLQLKIEGVGNAGVVSKPNLPEIDGLQLLEEPKSSSSHRSQNDQLFSTKTFDYIVRPTKPGAIRIPAIALATFSPKTGQYATIQSDPLTLQVAQGTGSNVALVAPGPSSAATPQPTVPKSEGPKAINEDINYIHVGALTAVGPGALTGEGPLFLVLIASPPALLLAGYLVGRRRVTREANRDFYRSAAAGDVARRHLRKAARLLKDEDRLGFYEELARAMRGYFGDKFRLDPSGLTGEQIEARLQAKDLPSEDIELTRSLLDECDTARYAPVSSDAAAMRQVYENTAELLGRMEARLR